MLMLNNEDFAPGSLIGGLDSHCPRTYTPELANQQASWHALPVLDAVKWALEASDGVSEASSEVGEAGVPNTPIYILLMRSENTSKQNGDHCHAALQRTRDRAFSAPTVNARSAPEQPATCTGHIDVRSLSRSSATIP